MKKFKVILEVEVPDGADKSVVHNSFVGNAGLLALDADVDSIKVIETHALEEKE